MSLGNTEQENFRSHNQKMLSVNLMSDSIFCCLLSSAHASYTIEKYSAYTPIRYSDAAPIIQRIKSDFDLSDMSIVYMVMQGPAIVSAQEASKPEHFPTLEHKVIYGQQLYSVDNPFFFSISKHQQALISELNGGDTPIKHFCHVLDWWHLGRNQAVVHAHIDRTHIYLYGRHNNQVYYNDFPTESNEDILYFTQLAYRVLELNPKQTPLHVSGWIAFKSPLFALLHGYCIDVRFVDSGVKTLESAMEPHYYFDHYLNTICGS